MASHLKYIVLMAISLAILYSVDVTQAFAQSDADTVYSRIEIWALFYRLMVVAFVIGAVVMGVIGFIVFRFREGNKKNIPREPMEGAHH